MMIYFRMLKAGVFICLLSLITLASVMSESRQMKTPAFNILK